jgi:trk system potassium uptake protein TrkA
MVFTANDRTAEQHIVIAGAGRVGHRTAQALDDYGQEVYLIERDSATVERVTGRRTGVVIEGDATDPDILGQTDPERADVLAALTGDDTTNFAICAEMRHLTDDIRTLEDVTGDLDVLDVRIDPRSPAAGKELKEILFPDGSQVISDADGTEIARPETTLEPGRRYLVAAEPSVADDVQKLLVG